MLKTALTEASEDFLIGEIRNIGLCGFSAWLIGKARYKVYKMKEKASAYEVELCGKGKKLDFGR